jgi:thiol:disulfide interchange protein/DsbC/DsbD-like thiol-disulfide interchange protein
VFQKSVARYRSLQVAISCTASIRVNGRIYIRTLMTKIIERLKLGALLFIICVISACSDSKSVSDNHITVTLIADQDSVSRGSNFTLGVDFKLEPGWHIYWRNPGDSGLPPRFSWSSSGNSVVVRDPVWPYPQRLASGPLVNYGYGDVLIPFPASVASDIKGSTVTIALKLEWLVCKDECLPGSGNLKLVLPITSQTGYPSKDAALFAKTYERVPAPLDRVSIAVEEQPENITIALIPLESRQFPNEVLFFPEDRRIISNASPQEVDRDGDSLRITLARDRSNREPIDRIRGVLVAPQGWSPNGAIKAVLIDTNPGVANIDNAHGADAKELLTADTASSESAGFFSSGFMFALISAFIGGVILNLMPCVFPVLSIKILSFIEHAKHDQRITRRHGLVFALGVIASFWVIALIISSVKAGGEQLGWGFQLQSPVFVALMIIVFLSLGLLFLNQITIGQTLQNVAGKFKLSTTYLGSFLSGVLATAVATPCTAPFMSTALAATLTLPTALTLLVFTALGCGMSAPYVLLAFNPTLLRLLPRPGEWMESFKQLMAFPLFATVVWLIRVFARQMGFEPPGLVVVADLLWGLLVIGFAFWVVIRAAHFKLKLHRSVARILALGLFVFGIYTALPNTQQVAESRARACAPNGEARPFTDAYGLLWESYSEERLSKILAQGRPVFLDFTAEWCITCQVNERVVFSSPEVREMIVNKNVTLMRGDWTSKNPAITSALRRFGRAGVPLNVLITSATSEPVILPNILTPGVVLDGLRGLG